MFYLVGVNTTLSKTYPLNLTVGDNHVELNSQSALWLIAELVSVLSAVDNGEHFRGTERSLPKLFELKLKDDILKGGVSE